jgi:glycosyltransferase involved in cell wall biosynthesis
MYQGHRHLVKTADLCVATATKLFEEMKAQRPDALLCPNGADYPFFSSARDRSCLPAPSDLRQLVETGRPIVGYHGALARWFDYELLWRVSRARPQWQFVLIGPDYDSSLLPSGVTALPNVYWLGSRAYSTLNAYLAYFDVAMIPFKLNQITASTSPIKLFEYMAAGKPVVSTALPECARYPVVLVAKGQEAFVAQLGQALHLRDDPGYLRLLDRTARENSWERRAKQVIAALESASCGTQGKGGSRQPG